MILTLVDSWDPSEHSSAYWDTGSSDSRCRDFGPIIAKVKSVTEPYRDRVRIIRARSVDAAAQLAADGERFDLVFIDAAHDEANCRADVLAWAPLANVWIGGHDYGKKRFPGVTKVIDDLYPQRTLGLDSTWWVRLDGGDPSTPPLPAPEKEPEPRNRVPRRAPKPKPKPKPRQKAK